MGQEPEDETAVTPEKKPGNKVLSVVLGFCLAVGPVATAYLSYKQSKIEAAAEQSRKESAAGYETIAMPMNQIIPILVQQGADLQQLKTEFALFKGASPAAVPMTPALTAPVFVPAQAPEKKIMLRALPKTLDDAAQQMLR